MPLEVVCAAIIDEKNRVLIAKRPNYKIDPGLYEFPGGKVEEGESKEDALIREIAEELGCVIEVGEYFHNDFFDYQQFSVNLHFFISRIKEGVIIMREHLDLKWIAPCELSDANLLKSNQNAAEILQKVLKGLK